MRPLRSVVVTGLGLCCPLGDTPADALANLKAGAILADSALDSLPDNRSARAQGPDLRPWLKRRKDGKLLARPAELALAAAGAALAGWEGDRLALGLYLGVGREPPDQGDAEPCLASAARDGVLDVALLSTKGRDLYPPLLPLRTLPSMALAHISINLGAGGENAAWAGGAGTSWTAIESAYWAIAEGRTDAALAGGADSLVDLGSARDRLRAGATGPPGEAAALLRLEAEDTARGPILAWIRPADAVSEASVWQAALRASTGDCGAAEGALILVLALAGALAGLDPLLVIRARDADARAEKPGLIIEIAGGEPGLSPLAFELRLAAGPAAGVHAGEAC